jgi:transposase
MTNRDWQTERHFQAAWLYYNNHWQQKTIALALGVTKGAMGQWVKNIPQEQWKEALKVKASPGRPPLLTDEQKKMWRWLKDELGNVCCPALEGLKDELVLVIARLRRRSDVLEGCFKRADLQI